VARPEELPVRHRLADHRHPEAQNMAFAVMIGLFLFGLTFGVLYFAAHAQ
jgi:hypothetical protein